MKKFLLLLFAFFIWINNPLFGQNSKVLRMEESLSSLEENSNKVDVWNELAWLLRKNGDTQEKALAYAKSAKLLSERLKYKKGLADSYMRIGVIEKIKANFLVAEQQYKKALKLRKEFDSPINVAKVYNNIGTLLLNQGKFIEAIIQLDYGLSILETSKDKKELFLKTKARLSNNLGDAYGKAGEFNKALPYLESGIEIRKELGDTAGLAPSFLNAGIAYAEKRSKELAKSSEYLQKSLRLYSKDLNQEGQAKCLFSIGNLFYRSGQTDSTEFYYNKALETGALSMLDSIRVFRNRGSINFDYKEYDKALKIYLNGLQKFERTKNYAEIAALYADIGNVYYEKNDYNNAITYLDKSFSLSDSLNLLDLKFISLHSLSRFRGYALKEEKQQKKEIVILGATLFLMTISVAMFLVYFNRKKRQLAEKNAAIANQEIDELLIQQELNTIYAKFEGQEEERKRVASDLHDRIGVMLSTVKLYFAPMDAQIEDVENEDREKYKKANILLNEACQEVRRISHNMASPILVNLGLEAQLEILAKAIQDAKQLDVFVKTHGMNDRLDGTLEVKLYRIIQELIGNSLKHAKASQINILLNKFEDLINIMVEDNGIGFDPESKDKVSNGMGFHNISSRVKELTGTLNIDSIIGKGTTISIDIPLSEASY